MDKQRKFEAFIGGDKPSPEAIHRELSDLVGRYVCDIREKPKWCVLERLPGESVETVYMFVRPAEEAQFVAHKIAKIMRDLGSNARAAKIEDAKGAKTLDGEPVENLLK